MNYTDRITEEKITALKENQIFVFGSNKSGHHAHGSAKMAMSFGAIKGVYNGLQGDSYAIPTKQSLDKDMRSVDDIKPYIESLLLYAEYNPSKTFLVTAIGCGYAGFTKEDIAPLFREAKKIINIHLPESFWEIIK